MMNTEQAKPKSIVEKIFDGDQGGFVDHVKAAAIGAGAVLAPTALFCAAGLAAGVVLTAAHDGIERLLHGGNSAPSVELKSGTIPLPNTTNWNP